MDRRLEGDVRRLVERGGGCLVLVNPAASGGRSAALWPDLAYELDRASLPYGLWRSRGPGDLATVARIATSAGARLLVAVGGDGTVHEVVNGIALALDEPAHPVPGPAPSLAVVPTGRGDDLVRGLGLPADPMAAIDLILEDARGDQARARRRAIDLGQVTYQRLTDGDGPERRYFANVAGCGFDGTVTAAANRLARLLGPMSYYASLLLSLASFRSQTYQLVIDGRHISGRGRSIVVANCPYFGRGMMIAPEARPDDGLFDVIVMGDLTRREVVLSSRLVYEGRHLDHPLVQFERGVEVSVAVEGDPWLLQADGEVLGTTPLEYRLLPGRIAIVAAGPQARPEPPGDAKTELL